MKGKWRIKMPDYEADFLDLVKPAYILFDGNGGGEFAFGCVTDAIYGAGDGDAIEFTWNGNDEWMKLAAMDGPSFNPMAQSLAKFASMAATKPTSLRGPGRLLQQVASADSNTPCPGRGAA